ncbi:hypothetical protein B0T25DRAFT_223654 [Lasiosphaeria hispida]|uniref:Uncharacterized protein n=1 Tax=Lasiosphaeria hispida TaxID=260671 RepID=A0AAJ0HJP8_9PEZI|nr:hypothetical protein B0T25DRAFT_223654 [Lasiosphaeria hispida]
MQFYQDWKLGALHTLGKPSQTRDMARGTSGFTSVSGDQIFSASAGLEGIAALVIAAIGIYGALRIPIRSDAARKCLILFFATIAVTFLNYALGITTSAIYAWRYHPAAYASDDPDRTTAVMAAGHRLEPVARFFRRVASALCAVMVVEVAGTISFIAAQKPLRPLRVAVYLSSGSASVLALADCILAEQLVDVTDDSTSRLDDQFITSRTVAALSAVVLLMLILGAWLVLLTAIKAVMVAHKRHVLLKVAAITLAAAGGLVVVRMWAIAEVKLLLAPAQYSTRDIAWFYIADACIDRWSTALIILAVYFVGATKAGGLWTSGASSRKQGPTTPC